MRHRTTPEFWDHYRALPRDVQRKADKAFALLKQNSRHGSLHVKRVGEFWSARVDAAYRALAVEDDGDILWFWVGTHADYDRLLS